MRDSSHKRMHPVCPVCNATCIVLARVNCEWDYALAHWLVVDPNDEPNVECLECDAVSNFANFVDDEEFLILNAESRG